ncbi:J domain-containing protein [Marinicella rhabdoformis]|uniref:J domain-containing protein n=1 Tax=Marinicella rhabdoformis TaxID=2580566 RepID=UPI0012AEBCA2|nr:DnaJ domain-containing protein [Marinicella rhabdoformis]
MYPWDVLGIDETNDKKVIKKAYAKLIRKYRPDEAPEKFQEINEAYQFALNSLELGTEAIGVEFETECDNQKEEKQNVTHDNFKVNACIEQVNNILDGKIQDVNNIKNWEVVDNLLVDMAFEERSHVAYLAFQKCYDINNNHIKETGLIIITESTLQYLDSLFHWTGRWQEYQYCFTLDCIRLNFNLIEGNSEYSADSFGVEPWKRIMALLIDIALVSSICLLRLWLTAGEDFVGFFVFSFVFYQVIIELILRRETLGCKWLNYKANSQFYTSISYKQIIIRLAAFHMMFAPIYMILLGNEQLVLKGGMVVILLYIVWVIAFLGGKKYIHDELASIKMVKTS